MAKNDKGFIKIPRRLFDDFSSERHKFSKTEAFIYLSSKARFSDGEEVVRNVICKKGQFVTSLRELASIFLWSEATVRRFLYEITANDYIVWTSYRKTTVITLKNMADRSTIDEEEKMGDAMYDAKNDAIHDASNSLGMRSLNSSNDATHDAKCDAKCDALVRVLSKRVLDYSVVNINNNIKQEGKEEVHPLCQAGGKLGNLARLVFEDFYEKKNASGEKYYWTAKDGGQMKQLLQKIRFSRSNRGKPCDDDNMLMALTAFLGCITDQWVLEHLDVSIVNSKYNEIVSAASKNWKGDGVRGNMEVGRIMTQYDENKFKDRKFFK